MPRRGVAYRNACQIQTIIIYPPVSANVCVSPRSVPTPASLAALLPLRSADPRSLLWNRYIARYYLRYAKLTGAQLGYFAHSADGCPLALLGFGAAAWKTEPCDDFIG